MTEIVFPIKGLNMQSLQPLPEVPGKKNCGIYLSSPSWAPFRKQTFLSHIILFTCGATPYGSLQLRCLFNSVVKPRHKDKPSATQNCKKKQKMETRVILLPLTPQFQVIIWKPQPSGTVWLCHYQTTPFWTSGNIFLVTQHTGSSMAPLYPYLLE
ncbi:hypothetical protein B9Z19DRAFT_850892 [Tuber borchii]|uniref:Uncharacterized protein n=1 Tax=Tuber borchii TaxID=42251 RepID=A0A2T6ZUH7_TUBBO|nr:hypothetical protein B9Z19DRAFT_850892 [Tuber borchii]